MAISANTVWEVRTTGSDNNGGGYVTGSSGVDYSLQNGAQVTIDGATISAVVAATTTHITFTGYTPSANDVGNIYRNTGGTSTAGAYQVLSISGSDWVLDRAIGTAAQTAIGAMGGALLSPAIAASLAVASNTIFIKYNASVFAITTASTNVAAGCLTFAAQAQVCGYDTTRSLYNTDPNRPTLQIQVTTATIFAGSANVAAMNLILDGNSQTTSKGFNGRGSVWRCHGTGLTGGFVVANNVLAVSYSTATACTSVSPFVGGAAYFVCEAYANTAVPGFTVALGTMIERCISRGNTGAGGHGFSITGHAIVTGCVAYGNGGSGFNGTGSTAAILANCIATNNTGAGFTLGNGANGNIALWNCAGFNNTGGNLTLGTFITDTGFITLGADPFVNAAGANFSPNNNNPGGAQLRAAGWPTTSATGNGANYQDVGALQHQDAGGGGGFIIGA